MLASGTNLWYYSSMKKKHLTILARIYARPVSGTIKWTDIESLFGALGAEIEEREGSRVGVFLFGTVRIFHRPHPGPDTDRCLHQEVAGRKRGETMNNIMTIDGQRAVIQYDPDIEMFRGEFVHLSGGADFYAADIKGLKKEGSRSLKAYLEMCKEKGIEPYKSYSGRFNVRMPPQLHESVVRAAAAEGKSLNEVIVEAVSEYTKAA